MMESTNQFPLEADVKWNFDTCWPDLKHQSYIAPGHPSDIDFEAYNWSETNKRPSQSQDDFKLTDFESSDSPTLTIYPLPPGSSAYALEIGTTSRLSSQHNFKISSGSGTFASARSGWSSPGTFASARSGWSSPGTFTSARSGWSSSIYAQSRTTPRFETVREDEPPRSKMSAQLEALHYGYYENLHKRNLVQPFGKEINWSGKGQHVVFNLPDPVPLIPISRLGSSATAVVEAVQCRRIQLARKTIRCSRKLSMAEAVNEIYHLQTLRHIHIIQLVGSYLQGRNFAILTYPVADSHRF